jgi:hypothetical protein
MDKSKTPIFDGMAADLSACRPQYHDEILCPICLGRFGRSHLKELTKEHVLSKALGGTAITLTCKACNSLCGYKLQSHLTTLLKINESFRGNGEFRGRFTVFDETVPVGVRVLPGAGLNITARGGSPRTFEVIHDGMKTQARSKWSMQVNLPYSPGKASTAIAHAAYLVAFYRFGYAYILAESVNAIRAEILSSMEKHSERLALLTGTTRGASPPTGNEPESVIVPVVLETGFRFLLAMLRFHHQRDYWMFCALPHAEHPVGSVFDDLGRVVQILGRCDIRMSGDENGEIIVEFIERGPSEPPPSLV